MCCFQIQELPQGAGGPAGFKPAGRAQAGKCSCTQYVLRRKTMCEDVPSHSGQNNQLYKYKQACTQDIRGYTLTENFILRYTDVYWVTRPNMYSVYGDILLAKSISRNILSMYWDIDFLDFHTEFYGSIVELMMYVGHLSIYRYILIWARWSGFQMSKVATAEIASVFADICTSWPNIFSWVFFKWYCWVL